MIVTDAGIWVRALINEGPGGPIRQRLARQATVDAPELIDLEFTNVVRGLLFKSSITVRAAEQALASFLQAPINRHAHLGLVARVWQLRSNLTAYDASYVALAEAMGCELLTIDSRIAGASGIRCPVVVVP